VLGFAGVAAVHVGKLITFELEAADQLSALAAVEEMCEALLANPVIERYEIHIEPCVEPRTEAPSR